MIHVAGPAAHRGDAGRPAATGDDLSFTRLQDLIGLTPGNLITHLRKLEDAGYVTTHKNGSGVTARTAVALTNAGRAALDRYTTVLRQLLDSAAPSSPGPTGSASDGPRVTRFARPPGPGSR